MVAIAFTPVGNPNNPADASGYGKVASSFAISKYETSIAQYVEFLNAVARTPAASQTYITDLWSPDMNGDDYVTENTIARSGSGTQADPYVYSVATGPADPKNAEVRGSSPNAPIPFVDWFDAARFVNWLNNGATATSSTETGAYTLNGATSGFVPRNADAKFWLPTENEWYKAAYYDPQANNGAGGYWLNAARSNALPEQVGTPPGPTNAANYNGVRPEQYKLVEVGSYALSPSSYGTFDQAGNLWEWSGTNLFGNYIVRGGSWSYGITTVESIQRRDYKTDYNDDDTGFRVATHVSPYAELGALPTPQLHFSLTGYEQISSLYLSLLNRDADGPGFKGWLQTLASQPSQKSLETWRAIADTIGQSAEAKQTFVALANPVAASQTDINIFVNSIYRALFSRDADHAGLVGWSGVFKEKAMAGQAVGSMIVDIVAATNNAAANSDHMAVIRNAALGVPDAYPLSIVGSPAPAAALGDLLI